MSQSAWSEYRESFGRLSTARIALHRKLESFAEEIKRALYAGGEDTAAALALIRTLSPDKRLIFHKEIVEVALSVHGQTEHARALLSSIAPAAVLAHCELLCREGVPFDFERLACMIEILGSIGADSLALTMAENAVRSSDLSVREVGSDYLTKLREH